MRYITLTEPENIDTSFNEITKFIQDNGDDALRIIDVKDFKELDGSYTKFICVLDGDHNPVYMGKGRSVFAKLNDGSYTGYNEKQFSTYAHEQVS